MKKLTTLLAIFAIAGLGLTSCDQSGTDEIVYPSFEKVTLESVPTAPSSAVST